MPFSIGIATLPDGDPRLVNHQMFLYIHTDNVLHQDAARVYFPRFFKTVMLRRTLGDVINLGGKRGKYIVGQEILKAANLPGSGRGAVGAEREKESIRGGRQE